ncbi:MAG: TonB family protein [Gemmatimonadota bacterium]|nr:TonB family protein [Gemmatimonadota bacterium]
MNEQSNLSELVAATPSTANERFKRSFSSWFWGSITAAVVLHFAVFEFWPQMQTADVSITADQMEVVAPPPDVDIPPPPEAIRRPATPVISTAALDEDLTIETTTFDTWTTDDLPPPPEEAETADISQAPQFVVHTVKPKMLNQDEVNRVLQREYPALLKDAGIGGTTTVWLFIDEAGVVQNQIVKDGSGHAGLDAAALKIVTVARFSPAQNRDKTVALWISLDIKFEAN